MFFDVRWKFFMLKPYNKETKKRLEYQIFYAMCKQG